MKTHSRVIGIVLLLALVIPPAANAGWSNVWIWNDPASPGAVPMQVQQIPGYDTFTLKPSLSLATGNAKLRIVVSGCTFDQWQYVMNATANQPGSGGGAFGTPTYTVLAGLGFSMSLSEHFVNVVGHKPSIKYFVDVAPGAQTDVTLTMNNGILQQVSVNYGRPAVTGIAAPFTPVFTGGMQGKVKISAGAPTAPATIIGSSIGIGVVNVIGGWIEDVKCVPTAGAGVGQIYAVYCRKVTNKKLGITYGGVIGTKTAGNGIVTPGNIGTVMANNGFGSVVRPGVPEAVSGRILAGAGTVPWDRSIAAVYMPAGSVQGAAAVVTLISAGSGSIVPPPVATLYGGTVRNIVIGNKMPTAACNVISKNKPKVSGAGKAAAAGTIYWSGGSSYPLNTP